MEKDFVPSDRALRMKAIGFNEPCFGIYDEFPVFHEVGRREWCLELYENMTKNGRQKKSALAPTFSQAFRWFREKHNLIAEFNWHSPSKCYATSIYPDNFYLQTKSYEQAELACLDRLIEIVKSE